MSKNKTKTKYLCNNCGEVHPKYNGKCHSCQEYGTIVEFKESEDNINENRKNWVSLEYTKLIKGNEVNTTDLKEKISTGISELDTVFGGGLTVGSINLISGEPGVGKSTLLIQAATALNEQEVAAYISAEESLQQIRNRAKRLKLNDNELYYLSETNVENIIEQLESKNVKIAIIDSIQTIYTNTSKSSAGSASQLRDCAGILTNYAKNKNVTILLVGHVTKDGSVAGPKILEHIVDGVFQLEGDKNARFRIMRTFKNRFGEANEIGIFAMTEKGMIPVANPSAMFISNNKNNAVGSSIMITKEGRRSIMYEIQSLITSTELEIPKRLTIGFNNQRFQMLLAIMQKHSKINVFKKDVYVSIVGGVQIPSEDTSIDLPLAFSIYSSINDIAIPKNICAFGEISLTGEIRPVPFGEDRIKEAEKHGLEYIFVPKDNKISKTVQDKLKIKVIHLENIKECFEELSKILK